MSETNDKPITVCGLWMNETKDGRRYLSGRLGDSRVLIFENAAPRGERAPTHRLCLVAGDRPAGRDDGDRRPAAARDDEERPAAAPARRARENW